MCELAKRITVPVSLDFMSVSSYVGHIDRITVTALLLYHDGAGRHFFVLDNLRGCHFSVFYGGFKFLL